MFLYTLLNDARAFWDGNDPVIRAAYDSVNAMLEIASVFMLLPTIHQARRTKLIVGLHWVTPTFYTAWAYWNALVWYPHIGQFWSWVGSVVIAIANTVWVYMVFKYTPSGHFRKMHIEDNA